MSSMFDNACPVCSAPMILEAFMGYYDFNSDGTRQACSLHPRVRIVCLRDRGHHNVPMTPMEEFGIRVSDLLDVINEQIMLAKTKTRVRGPGG